MTGIVAAPDAERIAIDHLNGDGAVTATASSRYPSDLEDVLPRLRVQRIGGTLADEQGHLDRARLQVDAVADTKANARTAAAEALASLLRAAEEDHALGVVTRTTNDLGLTYQQDPDTALPRYFFGVTLTVHRHRP